MNHQVAVRGQEAGPKGGRGRAPGQLFPLDSPPKAPGDFVLSDRPLRLTSSTLDQSLPMIAPHTCAQRLSPGGASCPFHHGHSVPVIHYL